METIIHGDCLEELKKLPENSVDSIVTDPPYGIGFMGKAWDTFKPDHVSEKVEKDKESYERRKNNTFDYKKLGSPGNYGSAAAHAGLYDLTPSGVRKYQSWCEEWARECLRVLKPGGHLLASNSSRMYHRMTSGIEDAGFEIRDQIMWVYSSGFPKSLNVFKQLKKNCTCGNMEAYEQGTKTQSESPVRPLQKSNLSEAVNSKEEQGEVLQPSVSEQSPHIEREEALAMLQFPEGRKEPSLERRSDLQKTEGKLQGSDLPKVSDGVSGDGEERRLHNATSSSNGTTLREAVGESGSSTSHRPQPEQQQYREPCAFCKQYGAQATRSLGIGTALKPSHEPITVARKPLIGTVAENVLTHGTGGLNIDGSRVVTEDGKPAWNYPNGPGGHTGNATWNHENSGFRPIKYEYTAPSLGRWPANLIHDGSEEVLECFPNESHRFFYSPKASKKDRDEGLEGFEEKQQDESRIEGNPGGDNPRNRGVNKVRNFHPTVKPTELMRYLVKLVTPKGGTVLDPFTGSGSTGKACKLEGFNFIGVEREEEYVKIARARIEAVSYTPTLL